MALTLLDRGPPTLRAGGPPPGGRAPAVLVVSTASRAPSRGEGAEAAGVSRGGRAHGRGTRRRRDPRALGECASAAPAREPGGDRHRGRVPGRGRGIPRGGPRHARQAGGVDLAAVGGGHGLVTLVLAPGRARPADATAAVLAAARGGAGAWRAPCVERAPLGVPERCRCGPRTRDGDHAGAEGAVVPQGVLVPVGSWRHLMGRGRSDDDGDGHSTPPGGRCRGPAARRAGEARVRTAPPVRPPVACVCRLSHVRGLGQEPDSPRGRIIIRRSPTAGTGSRTPRPSISRSAADAGRAKARAPRGCPMAI